VLGLLGLNSLPVVLQVHAVPRVLLGIPLVDRLLILGVAGGNVLEVGRVGGLRFLAHDVPGLLFLLDLFVVLLIVTGLAVLGSSTGYELCLDLVLNLGLLLLDRILREESVSLHEQYVDLSSIQDPALLQREDDLFVVSRLEGSFEGAEARVQDLEELALKLRDTHLELEELM
jgi:hypothetical protein